MSQSYLVAARRTPVGKLGGALACLPAPQLAAVVLRRLLEEGDIEPAEVDEVILGNVLSAGVGQAPARQAALASGIPATVGALTINKVCGSGMKAVMLADQAIRAGDHRMVLAGGMENMSRAPYLLTKVREGWRLGDRTAVDSLLHDGLWCATEDCLMGELADATARKAGVSRQEQDAMAAESHHRAIAAQQQGAFASELCPVEVADRRETVVVDRDEGPREDATASRLSQLKPAFGEQGTATPGNASQISDGAAALLVVAEDVYRSRSETWPLAARVVATAVHGEEPRNLFFAPIGAMRNVLQRAGWTTESVDLWEINEAFASQYLACAQPLEIPLEKINVHGGAIALGHPIGASGARVLVTMLHALKQRGARRGIATLCLGGGNAVAMAVENRAE